ncbi:cytochrome P450 2J2-like [Ixodes scapularis]
MEDHIMEELQELVSRISNTTGSLINVIDYIKASVFNNIAAVMFGSRFKIGDAKHDYLVKLVRNIQDGFETGLLVDKKPKWLSRVAIRLQTKVQINEKSRLMIQDFVRVKIGVAKVVILNDMEHAKTFYSSKEAVVRPLNAVLEQVRPNAKIVPGLTNLNGKAWTQNRTFILHAFRDLGIGKPSMEDHIMEELQELVSRISNTTGSLINVIDYIKASVFNNIAAVMFGSRFKIGDAKHDYLVKLVRNIQDGFETGLLVDKKPKWLSRVAIRLQTKVQINEKSRLMIQDFVREKITEHKNTLHPDFNRDFIDGYIKKIKESDSESASHFNENNLLGSTAEFLLTGTGPPSSQIFWFLHICAQNPNSVQNKI